MLNVEQLQQGFIKDIFRIKGEELLDAFKGASETEIIERFDIYRQSILNNLANNLAIIFPGTWQLIGRQRARAAAFSFVHQLSNLPEFGCLNYWGGSFPKFLNQFKPTSHLHYLEDYAYLDWYCHLAHFVSIKGTINHTDIAKINQDNARNCYFKFNRGVYFLYSKYPLEKIQHLINHPAANGFDLTFDPTYAIIYNEGCKVDILWLEKSIWLCLYRLYKNNSLTDAASESEISEADLSQLMVLCATKNLVKGLEFRDE